MRHLLISACIGVCMLISGVSAQAAEILMVTWQGKTTAEKEFEKKIKELQPGVKLTYIDAGRKKGKIAKLLRAQDLSKYDLVYSFGTTGTKIVKEFLRGKKPHVFNIVSAPVLSGIAKSIEKPGNNLTGARFLIDLDTQFTVLKKLRDVKKVAVWFDPREKQNAFVLKRIKKIAADKGFEVKAFRIIPDSKKLDKLISDAAAASNKMDALYFIASSSFTKHYKALHAKLDHKLLVMGTVPVYVENGSTISLGANWQERAHTVAEMANKVLKGAKAGEIPISLITEKTAELTVNKDRMSAAGLKDLDKLGLKVRYINMKK